MREIKASDVMVAVGGVCEGVTFSMEPITIKPLARADVARINREIELAYHRALMEAVFQPHPAREAVYAPRPMLLPETVNALRAQPRHVPFVFTTPESTPPPQVDDPGHWLVTPADLRATRHGKGLGRGERAGWGLYGDE